MARKDIFSSVMNPAPAKPERNDALSYVVSGASRSIKSSFEELAKGSVVELDPDLVDGSFVSDRLDQDDDAFQELLVADEGEGAGFPNFGAPAPGRFGPLSGCFRASPRQGCQAAWATGSCHRQADGGSGSCYCPGPGKCCALEPVLYRTRTVCQAPRRPRLRSVGHQVCTCAGRDDIFEDAVGRGVCSGSDHTSQSARQRLPGGTAGGSCRSCCKCRAMAEKARAVFARQTILWLQTGDARFNLLFNFLSKSKRPARSPRHPPTKAWAPKDKSVSVDIKDTGKAFTLALKAKNASRFGAYIADNLEELYRAFRESETSTKTGD